MNSLSKKNICVFLLAAFVTACNLDVVPPSQIASENFWRTEKDAWYGLNACYAQLPAFQITEELYTDNGHSHKPWEGPFELTQMNGISVENDFGYNFNTIRIVNNFLAHVDACDMNEELKERMKAESRFIRAYRYLELTNRFGKVSLVTEVMEYDAPNIPRDPVEKVHQFILDELAAIAEILPDRYKGGRNV